MNFIHLRSFDNYVNANIQLGMLMEEGINCHLQDEYTITIDPLLSNAIGGMKLMVCESQASRALHLLEAADRAEPERTVQFHDLREGLTDHTSLSGYAPGILQRLNEVLVKYFA
jgi:hypothetical protein